MTHEEQLDLFSSTNITPPTPPVQWDLIPTDANIPIPSGLYSTLGEIGADCDQCQRCELSQSRTHAVLGRGNPRGDIMIIGEGPGQNEDEQGLPFVGKSGQLLEKILASVHLDSETDVYIANMVKCLTGDTPVLTRQGFQSLQWIVEHRWEGEVLSVTPRKQLVWRKITYWYESRLGDRTLYRVTLPGHSLGYTATGDHPILTRRGWIPVEDLHLRDLVATGTPQRTLASITTETALVRSSASPYPLWDTSNNLGEITDWQPVIKHPLPPQHPDTVVYCLDVEETANFVTPAGVVHNCRPPGNRTPTPEEIAACKPYLLEQIRLVNPKIILFTGATAYRGLTGQKQGITKIRGQWIEWEGRPCMAIFHPAYLLRNPSKEPGKPKWLMWQDIQAVRQKLDELRSRSVP